VNQSPLIYTTPCLQKAGSEFGDLSLSLSNCYSEAIFEAGGIPWVAPRIADTGLIRESVSRCDGVMLTGGEDVQPALYQKSLSPNLEAKVGDLDPERDLIELLVISEVFRQNKPLLAICRGQQLVNVAFGGTLYVDIPTEIPDSEKHPWGEFKDDKDELVHEVALTRGSLLFNMAGCDILRVNSAHHQAVEKVADIFSVSGMSLDGVIEALELAPQHSHQLPFFLAVQFHPERLFRQHSFF